MMTPILAGKTISPLLAPAPLFAAAAFLSAAVMFAELALGLRQPKLLGDVAQMAPSTAVCFIILNLRFYRHANARRGSAADLAAAVIVAAIALAGLALLAENGRTGLDALVFSENLGVMSYATSACFLFAAAGLALLNVRGRAGPAADLAIVTSASVGLGLSAIVLTAHLFSWRKISEFAFFAAESPLTAAAFAVLFAGMLLLRPTTGWVGVFAKTNPTSENARRLLPAAVFGPTLCCYGTLLLTDATDDVSGFHLSVPAVATTVILFIAIYWGARLGNAQAAQIDAATNRLHATIAERNLLLRELNHRVKNNLQQTNAILHLEQAAIADPAARDAFERMSERVLALAAVHQILIGDALTSEVDLPAFLEALIEKVREATASESRNFAILLLPSDPDRIGIDDAITIGLLINELTMNAMKHAFPDGRAGVITISSHNTNGTRRIEVSDNGVGRPSPTERPTAADESDSYGSLIVEGLVAQLRGNIRTKQDDGLTVIIAIPDSGEAEMMKYET